MQDKTIILNPDYWDCECVEDYIHSKRISYCEFCETEQDDQPDSIASEVQTMKRKKRKENENTY